MANAKLHLNSAHSSRKLPGEAIAPAPISGMHACVKAQSALTQTLSNARNVHDAAPLVLQAIGLPFGWTAGSMWMRSTSGEAFEPITEWAQSSGDLDLLKSSPRAREHVRARADAEGTTCWAFDAVDAGTRAKQKGGPGSVVIPIRLADRTEGLLEFCADLLDPPDADVTAFLNAAGVQVGQAIHYRQGENALRSSIERFDLMVRGSRDGMWDCALNLADPYNPENAIYYSPRINEILGLGPDEMPQKLGAWASRVHPDDKERVFKALDDQLYHRVPYDIEYRMIRKDGSVCWVEAHGAGVWDEAGNVVRLSGSFRDINARKKAEEELRASHEDYRSLVSSTASFILKIGLDGTILFINRLYARFKREEIIGACVFSFVNADAARIMKSAIAKMIETGQRQSYELRGEGAEQMGAWYDCRVGPIFDSGVIVAATIEAVDVTEQRQAEAALRASEERYGLLAKVSPVGICQSDTEGKCLYVNQRWMEISGHSADEAKGDGWTAAVYPGDRLRVVAEWAEAVKRGSEFKSEYRFRRPDGAVVWVLSDAVPQRDATGTISGFVRTITDITARKRAEEMRANLASIVESSEDAICSTGFDGFVKSWNPGAERLYGYTAAEAIGQSVYLVVPSDRAHEVPQVFAEVTQGKGREHFETQRIRKDGTRIDVSISVCPLRDASGAVTGVSAIARDITGRKRAEEQARKHEEQVAHMARLTTTGELAAQIAHEINQPLAAILNYTRGTLRRLEANEPVTPDIVEAMKQVANQAERGGEIIKRIRGMIQKHPAAMLPLSANQLVQTVIEYFLADAKKSGVTIDLDLGKDLPNCLGDSVQIEQVLVNLTRNALHALSSMPTESRRVNLRTRLVNDRVQFSVCDSGPGVVGDVASIFQPFYTTKSGGLGLGLPISRSIVEAHGGTLQAQRCQSGGMIFDFSLPTKAEQIQLKKPAADAARSTEPNQR